jgi:hypothetical protein
MGETNLKTYADTALKVIIENYKNKNTEDESKLIEDLRNISQKYYFSGILEHLLEKLENMDLKIYSKYLLKLVLENEYRFCKRDYYGVPNTSYDFDASEILMVDAAKDFFVVKGRVLQLLFALELEKSIYYIRKTIQKKHPAGIREFKVSHVLPEIDTTVLLQIIEDEFKTKYTDKGNLIKN